jgi:serine protease Do
MHCRRLSARALALALSALMVGLVGVLAAPLGAQDVSQEESAEQDRLIEAARTKMYEALLHEVAALERQGNVLKMVVKLVRPTVVHIEAEKTEASSLHYGRRDRVEEAGSGYIVKLGGRDYVLTNGHVIRAAKEKDIKIRFSDGRQIHPTRVWSDQETDVAIMAISAPALVAARLGNSDELEIGDFVLAVGSPFNLSHSITFGIVSATSRHDLKLGEGVKFQDFIQTDAAINPGNSGGPLINLRGEVVGMNTAIASSSGANEGIGFSIPINLVMSVARQLVEKNSVVRAFLGVQLDGSFDPATAISVGLVRPHGARVKELTPGSPAAVAKLQAGDVILEYGDVTVDSDTHLISLVGLTEIDREVSLTVLRDKKVIRVNVKVGSAPSTRAAPKKPPQVNKAPQG